MRQRGCHPKRTLASIALLTVLGSSCVVGGDDGSVDSRDVEFDECTGASQAHQTFNAFWRVIDQEYALFDIRLKDESWPNIGREACAELSPTMSDSELYDLLLGMAEHFDDGHINLVAGDLDRDEDAWVSEYPYLDELDDIEGIVESRYASAELTYAAEDEIAWGSIDDIGYISITSMDGLSSSEEEQDDVGAAQEALVQATAALAGRRAIIVDVRANGGGWDSVALAIAVYFEGPRALAWSKRERSGSQHDDLTEPEDIFVEASAPNAFLTPVIVLTSGGTFSAAETFALAMRVRSNVTIIGERSSGHFSDLFEETLPNGWELTFSGQRYRAADGTNYETRGVPVDAAVAFDPLALAAGTDTMLEEALSAVASE